jgi:hypothetical protein
LVRRWSRNTIKASSPLLGNGNGEFAPYTMEKKPQLTLKGMHKIIA